MSLSELFTKSVVDVREPNTPDYQVILKRMEERKKVPYGEVNYSRCAGSDAEDMSHWRMEDNEIRAYHYPFACTGVVLCHFGGRGANDFGISYRPDVAESEGYIKQWISYFLNEKEKQFISVCTTKSQIAANKALSNLGFELTNTIPNLKYLNTELNMWFFNLENLTGQSQINLNL